MIRRLNRVINGNTFYLNSEIPRESDDNLDSSNMKPKDSKQTFLRTQLILAIIPTFITQIIAFYRIRKLANGIILELIIFGIDLIIQLSIKWPFGMVIALPITIGVPVYYVRKWTVEFNKMQKGLL
ncbi:MAG: hypothetical protein AUI60_00620 [Thaumarchaeota archaeon 13_1_40CM_2_39_4]|nr:MAG: hypothetical protein AUI60_00620 [Thaumarchaeota archaeon 13_1_40CM_2_39_4]